MSTREIIDWVLDCIGITLCLSPGIACALYAMLNH